MNSLKAQEAYAKALRELSIENNITTDICIK